MAELSLAGCGPANPASQVVPTVPAKRILLFQGKPLPFHSIVLAPDQERSAFVTNDDEGRFVLGTNRPDDGAVTGTHRVAVNFVGDPTEDRLSPGLVKIGASPPRPPIKIDKKYHDPKTSGITIEIPPGGNENIEINLK